VEGCQFGIFQAKFEIQDFFDALVFFLKIKNMSQNLAYLLYFLTVRKA